MSILCKLNGFWFIIQLPVGYSMFWHVDAATECFSMLYSFWSNLLCTWYLSYLWFSNICSQLIVASAGSY